MRGLSSLIVGFENALYPFRVLNAYAGRVFKRVGGQKAAGLSTAATAAILFFTCFAIFITIIWLMSWGLETPYAAPWHKGVLWSIGGDDTWGYVVRWLLAYLAALAIAIFLYWGIRLTTLEKPSLYPEIDQCWAPLEKWREKQNLQWHEFQRFLVLGTELDVAKAMHAEMKNRKLGPTPSGANEWMHWFGTEEAVYVHLKEICHTSQRIKSLKPAGVGGKSVNSGETLQTSVGVPDWSASIGMHDATAEIDGSFDASFGDMGSSLDAANSLDPYGSGEIMADSLEDTSQVPAAKSEPLDELGDEGDTPLERVQYLTQLMQSKCEGELPFHGVLVVIPFDRFIGDRDHHKAITAAVKKDLLELRNSSDVMFPVSFVFCSMEKDQGFPKLQNLLGSQRSKTGRFGAGCRAEDVPVINQENLAVQVFRACQSFEDWVINRWGKSSQLARAAQNKELFKMVVRVRQDFRPRLEYLFKNALIWTPSESPDGEATDLTLAGCYFVSTGEHASDRGFLNGLFLKSREFAQTSGWGEQMVTRDRFYRAVATILFTLALLTIFGFCIYLLF